MKLLFLALLLLPSLSFSADKSCYIETYPTIYKLSNDIPFSKNNLVVKTNCPKKTQNHFFRTIGNLEGSINAKRLQVMISNKLKIIPAKIEVIALEDYLKEKLSISKQKFIKNLKFTQQRKYLPLRNRETLSVSCSSCEFLGHKSIKLTRGVAGSNKNNYLWAEVDLLMQSYALTAKRTLNVTNKPLSPTEFEKSVIYTQHPERYFLKRDSLRYYKLNRPLRDGDSLEFSAISPVHLVRPGVPVAIELKEKGIRLSGKALPTRAGRLGEIIQLINNKTKKPILGKVVDYNKVLVEL